MKNIKKYVIINIENERSNPRARMITKDDILKELRAGRSIDDICSNLADAANAAQRAYEKEQQDAAAKAARKDAAEAAAAAMNEYFKLRFPGEKFEPMDGELLDLIADSIMYGFKDSLEKPAATVDYKPKSPLKDMNKQDLDDLIKLFLG